MHFDDRLTTVLNQPVSGEAMARVQYVQLVDLLGTTPSDAHGGLLDSAYDRLLELAAAIPTDDRARLLRQSGLRLRSLRLVAMLAENEPPVAAAAIAAAGLREEEWLDLVPALTVRSRGILRHRRDLGDRVADRLERLGVRDRGLPAAESAATSEPTPQGVPEAEATHPSPPSPATSQAPGGESGIGAIVRKIEAYRREHPVQSAQSAYDAPRLPLGDADAIPSGAPVDTFDFTTDANGRIVGADRDCAPMVFGLPLPALQNEPQPRRANSLHAQMRRRQPVTGQSVTISGAPAVSGLWQIDAVPMFDEASGGFTGYAGRARRVPATVEDVPDQHAESDRMRQVLHELRTPAGAIQMGAEVIQQQLYGPTPHEYRAIAASIASDTALVLAGFEELDRLVKLDTGAMPIEPGVCDLAKTVAAIVGQIHLHTQPRESGFDIEPASQALPVAMDEAELERLVWRMLAGIAGAARPTERLDLKIREHDGAVRLDVALPAALASLSDEELFHVQAQERQRTLSAGMFGLGFTLRLAQAEAHAAGGRLQRDGARLHLTLPLVAEPSAILSEA